MYFAKFLNAFVKPRNLNFLRNKLYICNYQLQNDKYVCVLRVCNFLELVYVIDRPTSIFYLSYLIVCFCFKTINVYLFIYLFVCLFQNDNFVYLFICLVVSECPVCLIY